MSHIIWPGITIYILYTKQNPNRENITFICEVKNGTANLNTSFCVFPFLLISTTYLSCPCKSILIEVVDQMLKYSSLINENYENQIECFEVKYNEQIAIIKCSTIYVSLRLRVQNAVPAQPCVGKLGISLVLLNFLHCNFRLWFKTP